MSTPAKSVWITRARPGAGGSAERVRDLGMEAIVAPLLAVRFLEGPPIDLTGVGALAFTSANGVRAFDQRSAERGLPVYAVGAGTAAAAQAAGFTHVQAADGDVETLAAHIVREHPSGVILHPGAREPAGDLAGALAEAGLAARAVVVYETVAEEPPVELLARIGSLDAVLVHSPKAGRRLADILRRHPAPNLSVLCLSPQVARTLAGAAVGRILTAASPREEALLSLLQV